MAFGSLVETLYASTAAGTAKASFTSEAQINDTTGMGAQAKLPADFWTPSPTSIGRGFKLIARGIASCTGTPTFAHTVRLGTAGSTSAAIVLGSAALTMQSGVSAKFWELEGDVFLTALGAAGANSTVRGTGKIVSEGIASPFMAPVYGGAASPGTVATVDTSIVNFINYNVTCSANSASNTIQLLELILQAHN